MNMNFANNMNTMNQMNQMNMINQMNMMNNGNMMNNVNMMNNQMNMMNNQMNMMNNQMNMINPMMNNMNMGNNMMNNMNPMMMNNIYMNNVMNQMNMMNNMNMMNQVAQNQKTFTRLKKEFQLCSQDLELKGLGCQFQMENNNCYIWRVTLKGPPETPYEGGIFTIRITFPLNYPNSGPEFRFLNQIYHLNVDIVDQTKLGHICLNYLNEWTSTGKVADKPGYGVKQALIDIFCLFYNQNVKSAYNDTIAQEYESDKNNFNAKAKQYTQQYAKQSLLL